MVVWGARHLHTLTQSLTQAHQVNTLQPFNSHQTTPKHYISDGGIVLDNRLQQSPGLNGPSITHSSQKLLYDKHNQKLVF